jgi:arylsulfatase A-like enzyme
MPGLAPLDVLALAIWCGLAAGCLEVGTRALAKHFIAINRLNMMSQHFVWVVPVTNLLLFGVVGIGLVLATKLVPGLGGWFSVRFLCAATILPALLVAGPDIYSWAWLSVACGTAVLLVPQFQRSPIRPRRWLIASFPVLVVCVAVAAGSIFGGKRLEQWREDARPSPSAEAPNVLLVVLDTVRADRLSLYGYARPTSPALEQLARQGIRFDEARATAPWTLPSHASMFTGRWPSELDVRWVTPLHGSFPTLAEYLASHGYATAGFAANAGYCSYDTGLDRGFTHFEDYDLDIRTPQFWRMASLVDHGCEQVAILGLWLTRSDPGGKLHARLEPLLKWLTNPGRKSAGSINRNFLDWLSNRRDQKRPFFAFLNYYDAHSSYLPPEGAGFRFGVRPRTLDDYRLLTELWITIDKSTLTRHYRELISDCYDSSLAYLDQRLGELFDTLRRRGVLDRTVVIVTADHGEELGEHRLFDHGESLYRPEIRVPLLFVLPPGLRSPVGRDKTEDVSSDGSRPAPPSRGGATVVRDTVSLRDLPATIVDLVGLAPGAPFPGRSLARLWRDSSPGTAEGASRGDGALSELSVPNPLNPNQGRSPAARGPLVCLADGDYVYIRNERDGREQLFHERDDPDELVNLAKIKAMQPRLERLRERLDQMKAWPRH